MSNQKSAAQRNDTDGLIFCISRQPYIVFPTFATIRTFIMMIMKELGQPLKTESPGSKGIYPLPKGGLWIKKETQHRQQKQRRATQE